MATSSVTLRHTVFILLIIFGFLWYVNINGYLSKNTTNSEVTPDRQILLEVLRKLGNTGRLPEELLGATNSTTDAGSEQIESKYDEEDHDLQQRIVTRVEHALNVCKVQGYLNSSFHKSYYYDIGHMIVDEKYKFIYCYIPKVACTTWKTIFRRIYLRSGKFGQRSLYDLSPDEIQHKMNTYRKAMFVRDPLTRLLSLYLSKFRGDNLKVVHSWEENFGQRIVRRYRKNSLAQKFNYKFNMNITFYELIRFVVDLGPNYRIDPYNDHWLPMYRSCNPCRFKPDFIGHFEELEREGPYLLKWLGVDSIVKLPEIQDSNAANNLRQEYSKIEPTIIKKLHQYYSLDYDLFGYSTEETVKSTNV